MERAEAGYAELRAALPSAFRQQFGDYHLHHFCVLSLVKEAPTLLLPHLQRNSDGHLRSARLRQESQHPIMGHAAVHGVERVIQDEPERASGLLAYDCIAKVMRNGNLQIEEHPLMSEHLPQR